ncbi:aspartate carbamoyltransferase [Methylocaldum sp.]|uniref:aspartate carbamoyltransferase n=1 Tax=Methylocaldum sp. TaxID=1969727 RepID=UPI002D564231|nr:aspartate carbamoyltransferase [Methylocaldum sp.]HYE34814.1 aspartate carbamoyltransferase [Methylocaldum sp.]
MRTLKLLLSVTLLTALPASAVEPASEARLDEVAGRGAEVMPFGLEKTTHIFMKTEQGGRQQVVAKNPADAEQICLIREHLAEIATAFSRGDFSGPTRIHGGGMPGLEAMKNAQAGRIEYRYQELPDGAQIDYLTGERDLVQAIHRYFDAQLSDHARHAVSRHEQHRLHER